MADWQGREMAEQESDETKKTRILDGAREIILREGITSVTMEEVASRQGISKKTLYKYFPNKTELVQAAIETRIVQIAAQVRLIVDDRQTPFPQRIGTILAVVGRQMALLGDRLLRDIAYREPELWKRIDQLRREQIFGAISDLFGQGIEDGYVRGDIEARLVPTMFAASLSAILSPPQIFELTLPPAVVFRTITRILLGGILTDQGRALLQKWETAPGTEEQK